METYMMMLYVSIEQEKALKQFFLDNNWEYCKPDLSALTDNIGPIVAQVPHIKKPTGNPQPTPRRRKILQNPLKSSATSQPPAGASAVSEMKLDTSGNLIATPGEPHGKKRKLSSSQGSSDVAPNQSCSQETSKIPSPGTTMNLDGTMTIDEPISEATEESTVMDSLSEENRSNDDPDEWDLFNVTVKESRQIDAPAKITMKSYKVTSKDNKSIQCEEEESGASKVFKLPVVIKKEIFDCDFCDKTFTIQRHLRNHCKREHNEDIYGNYNSSSEPEMKLYSCDQCSCTYSRLSSLKQHQRIKHEKIFTDTEKTFQCNMCSSKFEESHFLDLHQADKHGKIVSEKGVEHECKYCGLTFPTFRAMRLHKRHHETHNNFVCELCGRGYLRMDSLKAHHKVVHQGKKRYHNGERKFVCEICGSNFYRRSTLKEHFQVKHTDEPLSHKCNHCEKTFNRPSALEHHINKVHLNERKYTCDKCNKMFYSKHSLHDHTTICTMAPEKKVGCDLCGKLFTSQHNYKLHHQAMHSTPALNCPCGTIVRWQSSVTKHKRRCSLYNTKVQKGRRKGVKYNKAAATETEGQQEVSDVVFLQDTSLSEETVLSEMAANGEGSSTIMVREAEPDVAESVGKLLDSIPQDALGEGTDKQNITVMQEQVGTSGETTYSNVSVVTQEGQDSQKVYYVIQY